MSKRILVVEDDPDTARLIRDRLALYGYAVDITLDGAAGLNAFSRNHYDGMTLGIRMPGASGFEVLREVRKTNQTLPIIVISGAGLTESQVKELMSRVQDFISKPFEAVQLKQAADRWFGPA